MGIQHPNPGMIAWSGATSTIISDIIVLNNINVMVNDLNGQDYRTSVYLNVLKNNIDNINPNAIKSFANSYYAKPKQILFPLELKQFNDNTITRISVERTNIKNLVDLEKIGKYNFSYMGESNINIDLSNNINLLTIDDYCFISSNISSLILPPNLKYIGNESFSDCNFNNVIVEIPETLETFGLNVFRQPSGNITLKFKSSTPPSTITNVEANTSLGVLFYDYISAGIDVLIPRGSLDAYISAIFDNRDSVDYVKEHYSTYVEHLIEYDPE